MNAVDPAILLCYPELSALESLRHALSDASASLERGSKHLEDPARLLLVALLEELLIAVRGYHELRVASEASCLLF
jgi:hypothetical protein